MADVVFILGAGASATAGAPLVNNFLEKANDILLAKQAGEYEDDFRTVFDAIGALQQAQPKADLDLRNLESVFTAFEMAEMVRPGFFAERQVRGSPVKSIKNVIVHTLEYLVKFPVS